MLRFFRDLYDGLFGQGPAKPVKDSMRRQLLEAARSHVRDEDLDSLRVKVAVDLILEDGVSEARAFEATNIAIEELRQKQQKH